MVALLGRLEGLPFRSLEGSLEGEVLPTLRGRPVLVLRPSQNPMRRVQDVSNRRSLSIRVPHAEKRPLRNVSSSPATLKKKLSLNWWLAQLFRVFISSIIHVNNKQVRKHDQTKQEEDTVSPVQRYKQLGTLKWQRKATTEQNA